MKIANTLLITVLALGLGLASCDNDEVTSRTVNLRVKAMNAGEVIQLTTDYDVNGQVLNFDEFKFFLSDVSVRNSNNAVLANNSGNPLLVTTEQTQFNIGETEAEDFQMLRFSLGLDSVTNHQDPLSAPAPLNDATMHWNWNPAAGYKFFRMEGTVDGENFVSHAAKDVLFRPNIEVSVGSVTMTDENVQIELVLELSDLLEGLPVPSNDSMLGDHEFNVEYMNTAGTGMPFSSN